MIYCIHCINTMLIFRPTREKTIVSLNLTQNKKELSNKIIMKMELSSLEDTVLLITGGVQENIS